MPNAMQSIVTDLLRQVAPKSKKSVAFHPEVPRMDLAVLSDVKRMMQHLHAR